VFAISRSPSGRRLPLGPIAVAVLLVVAGWLVLQALVAGDPVASPAPTPSQAAAVPGLTALPSPTREPAPVPDATPASPATPAGPSPSPPAPTPELVAVEMPFVPVSSFWSTTHDISFDTLLAALGDGRAAGYDGVIVPDEDRQALAGALGITISADVRSGDADDARRAVRRGSLGVLRLVDVTPAVRVLSIDGRTPFGNDRLTDLADWPLRAQVLEDDQPFDPTATWTVVAVGDILIDRGVANRVFTRGHGVDYPYAGGTARITDIHCCSRFGWPIPTVEKTGKEGAVREILQGGDLTMGNLESAVVPNARIATGGFRFHGRPEMLDGIANAGFDFLSLANNHIGDAGEQGILNAMRELDARGVVHAGAGRRPADARRAALMTVNGQRVAILACDAIQRRYWVSAERVGAQSCHDERFVDEIRTTRDQADVVIVFPHWGREYRVAPRAYQRSMASDWVAAGADVVIGAHSHWAGAIEEIDGRLVFYSLGNFVFDQNWQTETQLGLILELTFHGDTLMQAWLHPTIIVDQAQPNLLDPEGDGQRVIDLVRDGSQGLLPY
jgi:hypothetical protein